MTTLSGFPANIATVDPGQASVTLRLDTELYPLGAIYAASYVLLDRAYLLLEVREPAQVHATLSWKKPPSDAPALERLAGEFANELLSCAWRARISEDGRAVIESATARALSGAMGAPSLDDLESFDFGEQPLEDPLGIATSWEDKYGKKKKDEEAK